ncbi:O-antigen polymerase [Thermodesulfobium narugense DSM 14796]|uniref:O-antigen polymerase n=1 Tax=Thermodesulfobium narugense DSM 14796 TaxID=747365 RepID=M1E9D6_9BACT|nr:O-antigen ligase family protein [Thermodesulfobium narugense]AEE15119.1 O-antigen polymerase [Thermodesulfobium narugense DSM 14796]
MKKFAIDRHKISLLFFCLFLFSNPLSNAVDYIFLTLSFLSCLTKENLSVLKKGILPYALLLFGSAVLSGIAAADKELWLRWTSTYLEYAIVIFVTYCIIKSKSDVIFSFVTMTCSSLPITIYAFFFQWLKGKEVVGSFHYYTAYSAYQALALLAPFILAVYNFRKKSFYFWFVIYFFEFFVLYISSARGSFISSVIGLCLFVILIFRTKGLIVATAIFLFGLLAPIKRNVGITNFLDLLNFTYTANHERIMFWKVAIFKIFPLSPIIGVGAGHFAYHYRYLNPKDPLANSVAHAHDTFIQVLTDMGIVGLACLLTLLYQYYKQTINIFKNSSGFQWALSSVLLTFITGYWIGEGLTGNMFYGRMQLEILAYFMTLSTIRLTD